MPNTKLVFTLGPATDPPDVLASLLQAGMDCARFNFSHGTQQEHARRFYALKRAALRQQKVITTLLDLAGPKLRVGSLPGGSVELVPGKTVRLTSHSGIAKAGVVPVNFKGLATNVRPGDVILLDDGTLNLEVLKINHLDVLCQVKVGGVLQEHKGINLPASHISLPALTSKDINDLAFGMQLGMDYVALSFVRQAQELIKLRRQIKRFNASAKIIAKIEKPQALPHLEEIILVVDGVMVARGDLGVEINPEKVPTLQKRIIALANQHGRLVITATQMLQSMMEHPLPTRAEASDVANAIFDGSDAVMLSGETAAGHYPRQAAAMMAKIVQEAEQAQEFNRLTAPLKPEESADVVVTEGVHLAEHLNAKYLVVFTRTGHTAQRISRQRPRIPVVVLAHDQRVQRQLQLYWGLHSWLIKRQPAVEGIVQAAEQILRKQHLIQTGDLLVLLASSPVQQPVNFIKIHEVG